MTAPAPRVLVCGGGMYVMGGLERMIFEALTAVRDRGGALHVIVNRLERGAIARPAQALGASISLGRYRGRLSRRPSVNFAWDVVATSRGLLRDARRFQPTHVLVTELGVALRNAPGLWRLRRRGVRVVVAVQNEPATRGAYRRLWTWCVDPVVDTYVCCSATCVDALASIGIDSKKLRLVYNCAPTRPQAARRPEARDLASVVYVGQIIPEKGLDLLLEAVARLVARGRDVRLKVVGRIDGWMRTEYREFLHRVRARAEAPDLRGRVAWLGFREDVPVLMSESGVHCLPSRPEMFEGFGIVTVEAKQAGIPSVAFDIGPSRELIESGVTGTLCSPIDAESLAAGLDWWLADPARILAARDAIGESARPYDVERFREGWLDVLTAGARQASRAVSEPRHLPAGAAHE